MAGTAAKSLGFILVTVGVAAGFLNRGTIWSDLTFKTGISKPTARQSPQPVFVNKNWGWGGAAKPIHFCVFLGNFHLTAVEGGGQQKPFGLQS